MSTATEAKMIARWPLQAIVVPAVGLNYPELAPAAILAVDDSSEMMPLDKVLTDGRSVVLIGSRAGG